MHHNKSTRRIYADNHMIRTPIAGFIGLLVGLTLMFIIYPFIFSPWVLKEKISNIETKTTVGTGSLSILIQKILFIMVKEPADAKYLGKNDKLNLLQKDIISLETR